VRVQPGHKAQGCFSCCPVRHPLATVHPSGQPISRSHSVGVKRRTRCTLSGVVEGGSREEIAAPVTRPAVTAFANVAPVLATGPIVAALAADPAPGWPDNPEEALRVFLERVWETVDPGW